MSCESTEAASGDSVDRFRAEKKKGHAHSVALSMFKRSV